ncbi:unnamed protein product [Bemisia tabaci]|uniref:Uncharacterized protein n=1 Tax=Bemisia tabaci TaxID=7038 RepID=A0A9P0F7C7_BEMTA|nr:unnamed protein product [Bemisia tabaci]
MKAERIFQIGDTKHSRISSACELQKSNFSEKFDQNATKNGRGDNAQIIPAKESGTVRHKERRRKESFRRGERRDDASVKVVPLHINDVIDALKYCQRGSLTAVKQNYSRRKLGKFSVERISGKHRRFQNQEEMSEIDGQFNRDAESLVSDFVQELNIRYIKKCESEVRKGKIKCRKTLGRQQPKKWPRYKEKKLCERNTRVKKITSYQGSDDVSSLTMLSYLPFDQNAGSRVGKYSRRKIRNKHSKMGSIYRVGDVETSSDVTSRRRRRRIQSKSYNVYKENDTCDHLKLNNHARGIYRSKSQESTYKVRHPRQKRLRKNRLITHHRDPKLRSRRSQLSVPTSEQEDLDSCEPIGNRRHSNQQERLEKESDVRGTLEENTISDWNREATAKAEIFERLSGRDRKNFNNSLANLSGRDSKEDSIPLYNPFLNSSFNYARGGSQDTPTQNNYEKSILGQSNSRKEDRDLSDTGCLARARMDEINSDMTNQFKFEVNLEKNFQMNGQVSLPRDSDTSLIQQNSKIDVKIETSQIKIQKGPGISHIRNGEDSEKTSGPVDSFSVSKIPSDTFNKRYRKNRLNGNFGILSRISVPDFHQKEVFTTKNFRRPQQNKNQQTQNENNRSSNDPLKNIMLTQLVRQNSGMSLQKEGKVDIKKRYLLGKLSSDTVSKPKNAPAGCTNKIPNSASHHFEGFGSMASRLSEEEGSDSSLSESVIVQTMNRKQSKINERESGLALRDVNHGGNERDGSTGVDVNDQRSSSFQEHTLKHRTCFHQHTEWQHDCFKESPKNERVWSENEPKDGSFKTLPKKCAVASCNKHAVIDITEALEQSKQNDCKSKIDRKPKTCSHKKPVESTSSHKTCLSCTAPLTNQNSKTQPCNSAKRSIPSDTFPLTDDFPGHLEDVPYFRSPSQEDFQQYISRMQPCISAKTTQPPLVSKKVPYPACQEC